jgi:hypothetical protein
MPEVTNKFVLLTITRDEAKLWATGLEKATKPEKIKALDDKGKHHHVKQAQHHKGHGVDPDEKVFFESITKAIRPASEVLVMGHGSGKSNTAHNFVKFLNEKHQDVAKKIVAELDLNIVRMSENEVLAQARNWFDAHHKTGL